MNIAIIPARGGSKRIPRKNIRDFCGKPMIAWTIEAARASGLFEHVIVSTDDEEIAQVAGRWGGDVPFLRPAELATDHCGATQVITHATRWAIAQGLDVQAVCCLLATAPFMHTADLRAGYEILCAGSWQYVFSATEFPSTIFRSFKRADTGGVQMFFPEHFTARSQDLPQALHDAAQFYWGRPSAWLGEQRMFEPHSAIIMVPRWRVQDIDNEEDWQRAEMLAPLILRERARPAS